MTVPGECSVIGYDDIAMAKHSVPPLTTVALPKEQAGRAAVGLLIKLFEEPATAEPAHLELATQLMVRGSTGPAPPA
jgi:LacI family transcriptional regulator